MAEKDQGGDKTEPPTQKRLLDARKKGQVAKSKDVTSTVELIVWAGLLALASSFVVARLIGAFNQSLGAITNPSSLEIARIGGDAFQTFILITALLFVPVAIIGLMAEFFQAGPIFTFERMKPRFDHMNPGDGLKRMFSLDNLVEAAKVTIKMLLLAAIAWVLLITALPDTAQLMYGRAGDQAAAMRALSLTLLGWTIGVFVLVAVLDAAYQRFSFLKRMRMSQRDIRQEHKDMEGDPQMRGRRRQLHQEWSQTQSVVAARDASLMVVNPTHIAIALDYKPETMAPPRVTAKGAGPEAQAMREAGEDAHVPIVQNAPLARALYERVSVHETIPSDMFEAAAEAILLAQKLRAQAASEGGEARSASGARA